MDTLPLAGNKTVDLAVVGGGFTGCSAALQAARQGASVCLLEAGEIGDGGSGRNVGLVNAGLWLPPDSVISKMGLDAGQRLIDILAQAPSFVFSLIEREKIECEATRNGTLHLAHSKSGLADINSRFEQSRQRGAGLKLLDESETARRVGSTAFKGALFDARAGTIQPVSFCRGLANAAIRAGASVHTRSKVTRVNYRDGVWAVEANGQTVRAKSLLMATNAYHLGMTDLVYPAFSTITFSQFATAPLSETDREKILRGGEGCWDTALIMSSFRMDQAGRLIVGGIGDIKGLGAKVHYGWANHKLRSIFPALAHHRFEHAWRGSIGMTDDHIPKIVKFGPSALACFGYSGRGIGPGTIFGTQAADALLFNSDAELPISPIKSYSEKFMELKSTYYEFGATCTHALGPLVSL